MGASDFANLPHIGEAIKRKEDYRFLTGAGQYTDDVNLGQQNYAVFVRSPQAHALIKRIDCAKAEAMPGVVRIFTGKDIEGKMGGLPCGWLITSTDGTPMKEPPHPVLAQGKVRYVGDQVAMVVATTLEQAKNAAEAVDVEYDALPAVVSVSDAAKAKALPGVVEIFTGKDIEGKMGGLPCGWLINNPDGTPMKEPMHPILPSARCATWATM